MSNKILPITKENTLEGLIEGLDKRGLLVLQILLGQQAMKILTEEHAKDITKSSILLPNAQDPRSISIPT